MNKTLQDLMQQATALTRSGDLQAATALLQSALSNAAGATPARPAATPQGSRPVDDDVIDVVDLREVPRTAPPGEAGQVVRGVHRGAAGERAFRLYVPPQAGREPLPMVVMLHGCTQDAEDFATGTAMDAAARERGCYVLYPEQAQQANPQRCWNWFKHTHQQRGRGEPALLAGMIAQLQADHRIDDTRLFAAGLSAGGAMAAILGATYPDLFAAIGVHSGLAAGAAHDLPSALQAMQQGASAPAVAAPLRTIVFHGSDDGTVHPRNGEQLAAAMAGGAVREAAPPPQDGGRRRVTRHVWRAADGHVAVEHWLVHGVAHAWSGGSPRGSHTDSSGPDATREMLRFFLDG